jgi:NAD(P)H-nitrite reductase large subunit
MGAKSAVVVGGGLIGLQAAFALQAFGLKVTVVEILDRILGRILDAEGADIVRRIVEERGIRILTGCSVAEIFGTKGEGVKGVILEEGGEISCSLVIKATGVVPNIELVRGTKVEVNRGILVNDHLETSVPSIYAAGDVAETFDIARGYRFINANWPNAHEQGRIAGLNMAGKRTTYPGSIGMNSIVVYGVPIISMGLVEDRQGTRIRSNPEAHIYQKLVFKGDRLVGAILIGDISNTGLINDLIRNRTPVGIIKDAILEDKAQLFHFRRALRREEVEGVGIEWKESLSTKEVYRKKFDDRRWAERARCRLGETPCKRE